jgi:hypothetical protein
VAAELFRSAPEAEGRVRFFTIDWWRGCHTGDAGDPGTGYARHLDAIRARLPADLLALQESISLHNARLRELLTLQKDSTPAVRLGAARTILEMGLKIRQMVDLEQRMAELEELVAARDHSPAAGWAR